MILNSQIIALAYKLHFFVNNKFYNKTLCLLKTIIENIREYFKKKLFESINIQKYQEKILQNHCCKLLNYIILCFKLQNKKPITCCTVYFVHINFMKCYRNISYNMQYTCIDMHIIF